MSYYHFRTAGPIWLKFLYCFSMVRNLVQVSRILGFPIGNKGVLRTTGDRGRFFCGLWIYHGYPKFSDSLKNRRCLPLRLNVKGPNRLYVMCYKLGNYVLKIGLQAFFMIIIFLMDFILSTLSLFLCT